MGISGLTENDVVILKVCFGSDCEEFITLEKRRSEMQLRAADVLEVFFMVNKGDPATTVELYVAITKRNFLSTFVNAMQAATGRQIEAGFGSFPAVVEDGAAFTAPGFGPNAGGIGNGTKATLFQSASDPIPGLAGWVFYLIIAFSALAVIVFSCVACIIPAYKIFVKTRRSQKFTDDQPKKQKIHKAVLEEMKVKDNVWKPEAPPEEVEEDLGYVFDAADSEGDKVDADGLETEILPDVKLVTSELDPNEISRMSSEGERPAAALWPGATSLTSTSGDQNTTGRWGHARSRLKALELQLDQLLEKLPRGEEEQSEAAVANQLMAEVGAPRQRASYARPTLPDVAPTAPLGATPEGQPIRRLRRGPGPQAVEPASGTSRPISTVRRAPKLTAVLDDLDVPTEQGHNKLASGSPDKKFAY